MNYNIDGLHAFVRVAQLGTFRQAAEALFITQSALSRRIRSLETDVGVKLIDRTTRRVRLTVVGRRFLPRAIRIIDEITDSLASLKDMGRFGVGQVSMACIPSVAAVLLPKLASEYSAKYPDNRLRILDIHDSDILQTVLSGEVEFGIAVHVGDHPEIDVERLFDEPFVLACPRKHALARAKNVKWSDLQQHRVISVGRLNGRKYQKQAASESISLRSHWTYEVQHSGSTGLAMADAGLGVVVVPRIAMQAHKYPSLVSRPLVSPSLFRTIGVLRRKGTTLSPAAQEFVKLARLRWRDDRRDA